jgi:hypothetical protein
MPCSLYQEEKSKGFGFGDWGGQYWGTTRQNQKYIFIFIFIFIYSSDTDNPLIFQRKYVLILHKYFEPSSYLFLSAVLK